MHNAPQETFSCDILSLSHDGRGVARPLGPDGPVAFVAQALPGQHVLARLLRRKSRHLEAVCLKVLRPAPDEAAPLCPHADDCGGCPLQRMPYTAQLKAKEELLRQTLHRIGGIDPQLAAAPLPSPLTRAFRNKMELAFGHDDAGHLLLGQRRRSGHGVVRIPGCVLMPPVLPQLMHRLEQLAADSDLPAYTPPQRRAAAHTARGFWRSAILRLHWFAPEAPAPDDLTVYANAGHWQAGLLLLTSPGDKAQQRCVRRIAETLLNEFPPLFAVIHEERAARDALALGERRVLTLSAHPQTAAPRLRLPLLGHCLELDMASFFQVNTAAAQLLAALAVHATGHAALPENPAALPGVTAASPPYSLLDLYCGAGVPGLLCLGAESSLDGIEYDRRATELAAGNARRLSRPQARYHAGDAARIIRHISPDHDVILTDPPRAGMDAEIIEALTRQHASRLVYISCNPATLARDAALLGRHWEPAGFQPLDMFPHTPHLECVSLWHRKNIPASRL